MEYNLRIQAHYTLRPTSKFTMIGEDIINWNDDDNDPPTTAEIDAEVIRLQASYDALEYSRKRQAEYPDMGTQLNKIYDDGIAKWKSEMVDPIKAKYPKP